MFHLSPQGHHAIGLCLTVYLLGFTASYVHALARRLDQRDISLHIQPQKPQDDLVQSLSDQNLMGEISGRAPIPWQDAAAIVFPLILSELLWFRRLWQRSHPNGPH